MPQFDDIFLHFSGTAGDPKMGLPVLLKGSTLNLNTLSVAGASTTTNTTMLTLPSSMQPFVSIWAILRVTLTAIGDVASFQYSLGTTGPNYVDLIAAVSDPDLSYTDRIYGLPASAQGTAHYSGGVQQLSGMGITVPLSGGQPWGSSTITLQTQTTNTAPNTTPPTGTARVYVLGYPLH